MIEDVSHISEKIDSGTKRFPPWKDFNTESLHIPSFNVDRNLPARTTDVPLLPNWLEQSTRINGRIPQAFLGINIELGNAIVQSLANGEVDGMYVVNSQLSPEQIADLATDAKKHHDAHKIEKGSTNKIIPLSEGIFRRNWLIGLQNTVGTALTFIDWYTWTHTPDFPLSKDQHTRFNALTLNQENADILTTFFTDKRYEKGAKALANLYETASTVLNADGSKEAIARYRATWNQRTHQTPEAILANAAEQNQPTEEGTENHTRLIELYRERKKAENALCNLVITGVEQGVKSDSTHDSNLIKRWQRRRENSRTLRVPDNIKTIFANNITRAKGLEQRYQNLGVF